MESFNNEQENIISSGTPRKRLKYTESFKEVIAAHPRLISKFLTFANRVRQDKEEDEKVDESNLNFESDDVKITVLQDPHKEDDVWGIFFKVEVGDEKFFVKSVPARDEEGTGELSSLRKAEKMLRNLKDVEVVDYKLGYHDDDRAYFVSKWHDGVNLQTCLNNSENQYSQTTVDDLRRRLEEIQKVLKGFSDVQDFNILYDSNTNKLVVFDIFEHDINDIKFENLE